MTGQNTGVVPKEVESFFDKYQRGLRIVTEGAQAETGQTPKETIWTKNKAKLYHYQPGVEKKYSTPILIVYALINRPYVLDLIPGNSIIEYLTDQGYDVYMIDWGIPGPEDHEMTFEDYVLGLHSACGSQGHKALRGGPAHALRLLHGRHDERHVRVAVPRAPQEPHPDDRPDGFPTGGDRTLQALYRREVPRRGRHHRRLR